MIAPCARDMRAEHFCWDLNMDDRTTRLEEQVALMQADFSQMSDELYSQQREIETLKSRLLSAQSDSGILKPEEDTPPPHY
jgi:SlyX protein